MPEEKDYTILPVGHTLHDGRTIAKCPSCGQNGVCMDLGKVVYVEHYAMERFMTGSGEVYAKSIRRIDKCSFVKGKGSKGRNTWSE